MAVNVTHADYDAALPGWLRARDILAGEDRIKAAGVKYLPRLEGHSDAQYDAYKTRALFFNATARTAEAHVGMVYRRAPSERRPVNAGALTSAFQVFDQDADLFGTTWYEYAKRVFSEVIAVGRGGTLIDWSDTADRACVCFYPAENITNWRVECIEGRQVVTMIVLAETFFSPGADPFVFNRRDRRRVLRLDDQGFFVVDLWEKKVADGAWEQLSSVCPVRRGQPLTAIPFVFHGPGGDAVAVAKMPLADIMAVNLDHYRLDADYKHGVHYTALPTAWVSGFGKDDILRIGSSVAWATEQVGATAGFLEFHGSGLTTFERAKDHDERLMATLGARVLEIAKNVGESASAMSLRFAGQDCILAGLAGFVSAGLTNVLRWVYWWHSSVESPSAVSDELVLCELNTDYRGGALEGRNLLAVVNSWKIGAISNETLLDNLRRGMIVPEGRTDGEESAGLVVMPGAAGAVPGTVIGAAPKPPGGPGLATLPSGAGDVRN